MSRGNLAWLLIVPVLAVVGLVVTATAPAPEKDYELVRTIVDVLAEVDRNYVRELTPDDKKKLVEEMINGGLEKLDPHSQYFNEDELTAFDTQTEGQFGGIGVLLTKDPRSAFPKVSLLWLRRRDSANACRSISIFWRRAIIWCRYSTPTTSPISRIFTVSTGTARPI